LAAAAMNAYLNHIVICHCEERSDEAISG